MGFYRRVLPSKGPFALLSGVTGPDGRLSDQQEVHGLQTHEELERAAAEIATRHRNVFFAVGSYDGVSRKADAAVAKRSFFLDIDAKAFGGDLESGLRALDVFLRAAGLPPPSIRVHSGRGVHVYWCLDADVPADDWEAVAAALKTKCKELDFSADPAVTADRARVLRCPGTLNLKGQEPLPCYVIEDTHTTYSLEQITSQLSIVTTASAAESMRKLASLGATADALSTKPTYKKFKAEDIRRLLSAITLEKGDRDKWTKVLCGISNWGDKSEEAWELFDEWSATQPGYNQSENRVTWNSFRPDGGVTVGTLVALAREGGWEPDEPPPVQPALPMAPPSLAEQVAQQIESIEDDAAPAPAVVSDELMISAQVAVNAGGRSRFEKAAAIQFLSNEFVIVRDQAGIFYSKTDRGPVDKSVIDDLLTRYMPMNSSGQPILASKIMRNWGVKNTVHALGFHPGEGFIYNEGGKNYVNQYTPPDALVPMTDADIRLLEIFWKFMFPRPADQAYSQYLLQCYGHVVQRPAVKIESAPLIVGAKTGTGKSTLAYEIPRRLVGESNTQFVSSKTLKGSFSGYLNGKQFLYFDEIHVNGKWDSDDTANALKAVIAGSTVEVAPKYMNPYNIVNRVFVTATSNYDDAMSLPREDERRWGVYAHKLPDGSTQASIEAFFTRFYAWLALPDTAGKLRWFFKNRVDISGFNPSAKPPMTSAKRLMVNRSQLKEVQILQMAMEDGTGPFTSALTTNEKMKQYLHSETGKIYSEYDVREYAKKAGTFVTIAKLRMAKGAAQVHVRCWKDREYWTHEDRTGAEIKKELG
jgi:hypothetical protein